MLKPSTYAMLRAFNHFKECARDGEHIFSNVAMLNSRSFQHIRLFQRVEPSRLDLVASKHIDKIVRLHRACQAMLDAHQYKHDLMIADR